MRGGGNADEEQAEAVEDHDHGAALVTDDAEGEGDASEGGEYDQGQYGAEGEDEVLSDDASGSSAELKGAEEVFETIVHEHDVGLFEGGIGSAGSHGDADVGGGEGGGIVDAITDHGDAAAGAGEFGDSLDLLFGVKFGADFVEGDEALEVIAGGMAIAGEGDGMETAAAEFLDDPGGLGADIVAEQDAAEEGWGGDPDFGDPGFGWGNRGEGARGVGVEDEGTAAERGGEMVEGGAEAEAGEGFEGMDFGGGDAELFGMADDGSGEGVVGEPFHAVGDAGDFGLVAWGETLDGIDAEFAGGEGTGFVHGDDLDFGEFFDGGAAAEEDALTGGAGDGGEDGGGDGEDEGAGGGDHEQGHGAVEGAGLGGGGEEGRMMGREPPEEEHGQGEAEHGEGVAGAEAIGEALGRCLEMLGLMDEFDDALEGAFAGRAEGEDLHGSPEVEGAAEDFVADGFFHGLGFAGEVGFVGGGGAVEDFGIDGEQFAGFDEEAGSGGEGVHGLALFGAVGEEDGGFLGGAADEGADFAMGTAHGVMFEGAGEGEEEEEGGAFLEGADGGGAEGHGEHEEVDVELAFAEAFPDFEGGEPGSGEVGGGEGDPGAGGFAPEPSEHGGEAAERGGEELGFPLGLGVFVVGETDFAGDQAGEWDLLPAPEPGCGGAGDAGDGGGIGVMFDDEAVLAREGFGVGAVFAGLTSGEERAGVVGFGGGVAELAGELVESVGARGFAEGGDAEGAGGPVDAHGFEAGVGFQGLGYDGDEAAGRFGWGGAGV